jgi:ribonuclease P protein component
VIRQLFAAHKSCSAPGIKLIFSSIPAEAGTVAAGFVANKRSFKKAVERNRVRRLLKEAYRVRKEPLKLLAEQQKIALSIFFIYQAREILPFSEIETSMDVLLAKLIKQHEKAAANT